MPFSASDILKITTGKEMHAGSLASCAVCFELASKEINPNVFRPFEEFWLMAPPDGTPVLPLVSVINDWQNLHLSRGIKPDQAMRNLVDNYDSDQIMVLAAVTMLHMNRKDKCPKPLKISREAEEGFIAYCTKHDLGGITGILKKRGRVVSEELKQLLEKTPDISSRTYWRQALGHDVWIDAATQKPCACTRCNSFLKLDQLYWLIATPPNFRKFGDHLSFICTFCNRYFTWRGRKDEDFIEEPVEE